MTRSSEELLALADRCEAATGPYDILDMEIALAVGHNKVEHGLVKPAIWPAYTASLDAAMTLVPEGWRYAGSETTREDWYTHLITRDLDNKRHAEARAATGPLSICAAALRSLATKGSADGQ